MRSIEMGPYDRVKRVKSQIRAESISFRYGNTALMRGIVAIDNVGFCGSTGKRNDWTRTPIISPFASNTGPPLKPRWINPPVTAK